MPHGGGRVSIKLRRHRHHYTSVPVRDTKTFPLRTKLFAKKLLRVAIFQFHIAANEIDPDFADAANDLGLEILFRYLAIVQEQRWPGALPHQTCLSRDRLQSPIA